MCTTAAPLRSAGVRPVKMSRPLPAAAAAFWKLGTSAAITSQIEDLRTPLP